ncbi:MAG: hypothetical protein Q4G26_16135 [Paracoccus sp. (in: a-proteobacteria)]|nr:hypothetical protein [Paracoccus sp. (in: a-proteobacteria)]
MTEGAAITPEAVRAYANLPREVPDSLLADHIGIAARDLSRRTGRPTAPAGQEADWTEALIVRALASVFPWLNTFALDGAAKVGRLEGSVEYRFLDPEDVAARVDALMNRFDELVALLMPDDPETPGHISLADITMIAI